MDPTVTDGSRRAADPWSWRRARADQARSPRPARDCPLTELRRVPTWRGLGCFHGSIVSKNWSSIHPSAVHFNLPPKTLEETDPGWQSGSRSSALHQRRRCRDDSNGFQRACPSRHSNHFPIESTLKRTHCSSEMRTNLGDQGSQVRVLSPRQVRTLSSRGRGGEVWWAPARHGV